MSEPISQIPDLTVPPQGDVPPDTADGPAAERTGEPAVEQELVVSDLLVEEISIDGMCGVY